MEIVVDGVNQALPAALSILRVSGVRHTAASVANERSTLEHPGVFITVYEKPNRNVLFDPVREANPFFHYLETMWILAGRNDVGFLKSILAGMARYTDDGLTYHGAYGWRLRQWPEHTDDGGLVGYKDQVQQAIDLLRAKPTTRQVVMSIWNPLLDLGTATKDMPCNDLIMLKVRDGKLNLTVANRSNDAILGAYGANAVQFSMLQMYMAAKIGVGVGRYTQVSDSMHVYEDDPYWQHYIQHDPEDRWDGSGAKLRDPYAKLGDANLFEAGIETFDRDLEEFFDRYATGAVGETIESNTEPVFQTPAIADAFSMYNALMLYKAKRYDEAAEQADKIIASDWRLGCCAWLKRRADKRGAGNV